MHEVLGSLSFFSCWFKILIFLVELEHEFGGFFMRDDITYRVDPEKIYSLHAVSDICSDLFI